MEDVLVIAVKLGHHVLIREILLETDVALFVWLALSEHVENTESYAAKTFKHTPRYASLVFMSSWTNFQIVDEKNSENDE